jgi:Mg/Co/Ni transporter MgtE
MLVNLATAFLAAAVVGLFQESIAQVVALAVFMPVVAGMGGNMGNQTLTVITRGLALGELQFSSALRAITKQVGVGLAVGGVAGLTAGIIAYFWVGSTVGDGDGVHGHLWLSVLSRPGDRVHRLPDVTTAKGPAGVSRCGCRHDRAGGGL